MNKGVCIETRKKSFCRDLNNNQHCSHKPSKYEIFSPANQKKSGTVKIYDDIDNRSNIIYKPILCRHIGAITQNIGPEFVIGILICSVVQQLMHLGDVDVEQ